MFLIKNSLSKPEQIGKFVFAKTAYKPNICSINHFTFKLC